MASYLESRIKDWRNRGVIDDTVADALFADVAKTAGRSAKKPGRSFSFFRIVAVFAAVSFAAAILMFISANWAAIPRLAKVAAIMVIIGGGLIGGALVRGRGGRYGRRLEEAFYLVAGAGYVGGVALVGQMYHLPGDVNAAMLGFALGLGAAGLLVRSQVLSLASLGAVAWWHATRPLASDLLTPEFAILVAFCVSGWGVARWLGARWVGRAAIGAFVLGLVPFLIDVIDATLNYYQDLPDGVRLTIWLVVLALSIVTLAVARFRPQMLSAVPGYGPRGLAIAFAAGTAALIALHLESEDLLPLLVVGPVTLAFALFVLFAFGARSVAIRWFGYVLFVGEIMVLYEATVATLLGTAGLFLVIGLTLTLLALGIYVFERRVRRANAGGGEDG